MRSMFTPFRTLVTALGIGCTLAASAQAEEVLPAPPVVDDGVAAQTTQTTTTTTVTTTQAAPAAPAAPSAPPAVAAGPQAPPVPAVPAAPPVPGATGPMYFNGPVWVVPAPVTGQPVMQAPSQALSPPPVYVQPGYRYRTSRCCAAPRAALLRTARGPVFSVGLRFTSMGINQEVFGQQLNMLGGGLQLRFRNQGHWGFETAFDILRGNVGDGAFVRMHYPWSAAAMLYLFRNRPENHFNLFGLAGLGLAADDVTLYQGSSQERNQQFLEVLGQAGAGVELRFRHLALSADIRAVGLLLDTTGAAGSYYREVESGPIPLSSIGYKANIGAHLWF